MDPSNERITPALSWQPNAHGVHDGANADAGATWISLGRSAPSSRPTWTCLFPCCEVQLNDEEALDKHVKAHSYTSAAPYININRLTLAAHNLHCHQEPAPNSPPPATESLTDSITTTTLSPAADRPITCTHPGCNRNFTRASDLERHMKKHQDGPKDFHCWEPGCRRNGTNGFYRRDKLMAHQKRHS